MRVSILDEAGGRHFKRLRMIALKARFLLLHVIHEGPVLKLEGGAFSVGDQSVSYMVVFSWPQRVVSGLRG